MAGYGKVGSKFPRNLSPRVIYDRFSFFMAALTKSGVGVLSRSFFLVVPNPPLPLPRRSTRQVHNGLARKLYPRDGGSVSSGSHSSLRWFGIGNSMG
jgi:hypothetical protein